MHSIRTLYDVAKRLVEACAEMHENSDSTCVRGLVRKYDLKCTKLQRALATDGTPQAILALSDAFGRQNRFNTREEKNDCRCCE